MKRILVPVVSLALFGCIDNTIIRTNLAPGDASCAFEKYTSRHQVPEHCKTAVVEKYQEKSPGYILHFVEFDDQGWMHHPGQMKALFRTLDEATTSGHDDKRGDAVIVVYVHGWQHNADACDENVCCFRETLKVVSELESRRDRPRQVVGVYVGWRGLSNAGLPLWTESSFYTRKSAALRVAMGSSRELLIRLRRFQEARNRAGGNTRLMIVGHSFGALIVYSAISEHLLNNALDFSPGEDRATPVKGFGDLVVLVNPAFEAVRYEPIFRVARTREYPAKQKPVLVMVTADNDWATGKAFPIARTFTGLIDEYSGCEDRPSDSQDRDGDRCIDNPQDLQDGDSPCQDHTFADERRGDARTVGHVDRYRTHTLDIWDPSALKNNRERRIDTTSCECSHKMDIQKLTSGPHVREDLERREKDKSQRTQSGARSPGWSRDYAGGARLTFDADKRHYERSSAPDIPFWVVKSKDKRIIDGHGDFYTAPFLDMLHELYNEVVASD